MSEDVMTGLKVQIAELAVEFRNIAHDLKGALMEMKTFASQRDLEQFRADHDRQMAAMRLDHKEKLDALAAHSNSRFSPLEDIVKWAGRLVGGAIILTVLGLVMSSRAKVGL